MTEWARLEDQLRKAQDDLNEASAAFESSVETLAQLLGTNDAARINAAKDDMQMWSETVRRRTAEESTLQRRLEHLTTRELTRSAIRAAKSSSRAAWATFWIALFAMIACTTAAITTAVASSAP